MMYNYDDFAEKVLKNYIQGEIENALSCPDYFEMPYHLQSEVDSRVANIISEKIEEKLDEMIENLLDDYIEQALKEV